MQHDAGGIPWAGDTSVPPGCEMFELYVTQHSISMLYGDLTPWGLGCRKCQTATEISLEAQEQSNSSTAPVRPWNHLA